MEKKNIVIVGTNFGGYTDAIELKELVGENHNITVVANTHNFIFYPSIYFSSITFIIFIFYLIFFVIFTAFIFFFKIK